MPARRRASRLVKVAALVALAALAVSAGPAAVSAGSHLSADQRATLLRYANTTWASFVAMTDEGSGLPADSLRADGTRSVQTSTTNIGAYLWSTVVAERLGIIDHAEAVERADQTISTLETMERHEASGQFYNWYDHRTGAKLTTWPETGAPLTPILSSVDNGWLAAALQVVRNSIPEVAARAGAIYESMDFGFYYRPAVNRIAFHVVPDTGESPCCYDTIVSESRIASYIGIAKGELPAKEYFGAWRTFPDTCDWSWQETKPIGVTRTYLGVDVFEGAYPYAGFKVVPGWGGSMFEALMPALFVPEETWGPRSWGVNHPLTVAAQIYHGTVEAGYGYWGFSPSNIPEGGYNAYGVDGIGMNPEGYPSNEDNTFVDNGFAGCRDGKPTPPPSAFTNGVVTPHAAFLALRWAPDAVMDDLGKLRDDFAIYGKWGFRDSVNVDSGAVSDSYLSLDQGIIMAAIGNALADDVLRDAFATKDVRKVLGPIIGLETFGAGPRSAADAIIDPR
ncbi:MAG TPA: glucoamylase family protein [Candidatus Limnocylindrales bacterium]|nr:glucoamylase family protein [Candidatus Limnocylindrales bacterium]